MRGTSVVFRVPVGSLTRRVAIHPASRSGRGPGTHQEYTVRVRLEPIGMASVMLAVESSRRCRWCECLPSRRRGCGCCGSGRRESIQDEIRKKESTTPEPCQAASASIVLKTPGSGIGLRDWFGVYALRFFVTADHTFSSRPRASFINGMSSSRVSFFDGASTISP